MIWFDLGKNDSWVADVIEIRFVICREDLNIFLKWFVIWHYDLICDSLITDTLQVVKAIKVSSNNDTSHFTGTAKNRWKGESSGDCQKTGRGTILENVGIGEPEG